MCTFEGCCAVSVRPGGNIWTDSEQSPQRKKKGKPKHRANPSLSYAVDGGGAVGGRKTDLLKRPNFRWAGYKREEKKNIYIII